LGGKRLPTLIEINGIDEGGKIGEDIYFVRVGVRIDEEIQLLIRNLDHFGKLIVGKQDLFEREEKNLQKFLRDTFDDPCANVDIFRMSIQTQIQVLKAYLEQMNADMFKARGVLIGSFKSIISGEESHDTAEEDIWQVTKSLKIFEQFPFLYESAVKAYGMQAVTGKLDYISDLFRTTLVAGSRHMLVVQIDGGYPFTFWWHRFLESPKLHNMKRGNVHFAGITQGDSYYPTVSTAGTLAYIINKYPQRAFYLPVSEIKYNEEFPINEEYYHIHANSIIAPAFQDRLLMIGAIDDELRSILPYCIHKADRRKNYEPFKIESGVRGFFERFGYGNSDNTTVLLGRLTNTQQKDDVKFCKERGLTCSHITDAKKHVSNFFSDMDDEIDLLPKDKKAKLTGDFEPIKKKCLDELS
jgi:hypothetical protein